MTRPDLPALVSYWQAALRLLDWRISVNYVRDLTTAAGAPVYGLCSRFVDAKRAAIAIRDPETPAGDGGPSVEEVLIHELLHLHFAPLAGNSPAEIAAEEQAVWSISEAIVGAKGSGREAQVMRAMVAHVHQKRRAAAKGDPKMDPKNVAAAIAAIKSGDGDTALAILEKMLVSAAGGEAPPDTDPAAEAAKPPPAPPAPGGADTGDDKKGPPMAAVAAMRAADPVVIELAAKVQSLTDRQAAADAAALAAERAALASTVGLAPALVAIVKNPRTDIATAREIAGVAVRSAAAPQTAVAAMGAQPVRGETQHGSGDPGVRAARLPPAERAALNERMGVGARPSAIRREGTSMVFHAMTPEEARAASQPGKVA